MIFLLIQFSVSSVLFLPFLILLITIFNLCCTDWMQDVIAIFLYLLRFALCPNMWSIWRCYMGCGEKSVFFIVWVEWSILLMMSFNFRVSIYLFFCPPPDALSEYWPEWGIEITFYLCQNIPVIFNLRLFLSWNWAGVCLVHKCLAL